MTHITLTKSGTYEYSLKQQGEEINIVGRFSLKDTENLSIHLTIIHQAKNTKSHVSIKTTVNDRAKASLFGSIIIEEMASKSESFLEERVLLLSPFATAEAIPNLEIKTNDIKCSHAATIGQIDEEQLFYLYSRGISESVTKSLLAEAFLSDIV